VRRFDRKGAEESPPKRKKKRGGERKARPKVLSKSPSVVRAIMRVKRGDGIEGRDRSLADEEESRSGMRRKRGTEIPRTSPKQDAHSGSKTPRPARSSGKGDLAKDGEKKAQERH